MSEALTLNPGAVTLAQLAGLYWREEAAVLEPGCRPAVDHAARMVAEAAAGPNAVYGVNTGFGKLASKRIAAADTAQLQRNLILSHCCGVGDMTPRAVVRLMMALKMASLGRGASGVRWEMIELLQAMLARGVTPQVPAQGSVGASGDLAPLAHMAAVLMGEGEAEVGGQVLSGAEALKTAGLAPIALAPKEGLGFINGTQFSTAYALAGLFEGWRALTAALVTGALSTDAAMGSAAPFRPEIHALRGQPGQIDAARALRALMEESEIRQSHREGDERVQDPYCLRCQPQVMGACIDLFRQAARTLEIEANAVTDNPLVIPATEAEEGAILSGGNFHAEPVAFAADMLALAVSEIGSIAQRRVALLVDPALNFGLPPFLASDPGLNSGLMIAEVTTAALMSENKQRAAPASIDSTPTSANQEDHVSMAAHASRRLMPMTQTLFQLLGIELITAGQGVELRAPLRSSPPLRRVLAALRAEVPVLQEDRYLAPDLAKGAALVSAGRLQEEAGHHLFPALEQAP